MKKLAIFLLAGLCFAQNQYVQTLPYFYNGAVTTKVLVAGNPIGIYGWSIYNPNAAVCYLDIFNAASTSAVTLSSTVPAMTIPIPGTTPGTPLNQVIPTTPGSVMIGGLSTGLVVAAVTSTGGGSTCSTGLVVQLWAH